MTRELAIRKADISIAYSCSRSLAILTTAHHCIEPIRWLLSGSVPRQPTSVTVLTTHFLSLQWPDTHATSSIVLPFTSHLDSPHTASHGTGGLPAASTALHVQQSAKIVQSLSFLHSGSLDSVAASSCAIGFGPSSPGFGSALVSAAGSAAGADAGVGVDLDEPPQATAARMRTTTE